MRIGKQVPLFSVGQPVKFRTTLRRDFSPAGIKTATSFDEYGSIDKLTNSGRQGSAVIVTAGGRRVTRRLQNVSGI